MGARPVHLAGETVPQAIAIIRKAYAGILHNPEILVLLKEFEKPYIIVSGQVNKPGKYDLLGDTTVTQAVALAGGFNKDAKHSQVVLFRRVSDNWTEADRIDVKSMLNHKDLWQRTSTYGQATCCGCPRARCRRSKIISRTTGWELIPAYPEHISRCWPCLLELTVFL